MTGTIEDRKIFSDKTIEKLRHELREANLNKKFSVVINGSYARREASKESDLDFYVLFKDEKTQANSDGTFDLVRNAIGNVVEHEPAPDGAFSAETSIDEMTRNVGGMEDSNATITRRSLLLFEGDYIYGKKMFDECRKKLINRYISPKITDHQLALFMLNDLIRYYRTICVDFEFKTAEQRKPYGIRMIKLVFSRKLLFFGGVVVIAETAHRNYDEKIKTLKRLLALSPIDRIREICGDRAGPALALYEEFLQEISEPTVRNDLKKISDASQGEKSALFRELKNKGHRLSWELMKLLESTYHASHPIHRSLLL